MPLIYKVDVLPLLKAKGYNTNTLRTNRLLAESTIQKLRHNKPVSWDNLATICELLECQPGDIIEHIKQN